LLLLLQSSRRGSTAIDRCRAFTDERQSKLRQKNGYASRRLFRFPFPFPFPFSFSVLQTAADEQEELRGR
jgi:hypothetical protein